jgi:hypothetical protein
MPSLNLIEHPYLDETFGSWLHRCAEDYYTTKTHFVAAVLNMAGEAPIRAGMDWDIAPPPQLLQALAKLSPLSLAELEYLVSPQTPATLPPRHIEIPIAPNVLWKISRSERPIFDEHGSTHGRFTARLMDACWDDTALMNMPDPQKGLRGFRVA